MLFWNSKKLADYTDEELIVKYKKTEDSKYVGELFQRYTHLVFGVSMKYLKDEIDAQDAVMQIFEKLLLQLLKHEVENFRGWIHTVTRNHCLMDLRKTSKEVSAHDGEMSNLPGSFMEFEDIFHHEDVKSKEEQLNSLEEAIQQLNEEQRMCVKLFYLDQKSYKDVAELTGYTMKQVKSYIQNGKRNLKLHLEQQG